MRSKFEASVLKGQLPNSHRPRSPKQIRPKNFYRLYSDLLFSIMDSLPLVTIGIPVYNCEQYIELAIKSILKQTYANLN